ncbi:MAG: hypothetical protein EAZ24_04110 [Burkholderiales bacterium]|nr:MAG: hypothetical protein EAZ21_12810 [Betaproteobacteria bacterium]TAG81813.1 MAG: hypothetical protein EAZ24_04110 [Burkholderiales bacterium]
MKPFTALTSLAAAALLGLTALVAPNAFAHGDAKPKHGGIVQSASDLSFELVTQADGAALYVTDHGQPLVPTGMSGKLTVLVGEAKTDAELKVVGDKLEAKGVKLASGAKVVASVTTAKSKVVVVRFTVK